MKTPHAQAASDPFEFRDLAPLPSERKETRRRRCLLAPLHAERSLCLVLVSQLSLEMPDIDFTLLDHPGDVDVIWVCGYEHGAEDLVRYLRRAHPGAELLVTGREPVLLWREEALGAGADHARSLPLDYQELSQLFHRHACEPG